MGSEAGLITSVKSDVKKILMTMLAFCESEIGPHVIVIIVGLGVEGPSLRKEM